MSLQVFELFSTVEKKKYNDYCKNYHSPGASKLNVSPDKLAGVKVLTALTDDFLDPYTYIHICRVHSGCVYTASYNVHVCTHIQCHAVIYSNIHSIHRTLTILGPVEVNVDLELRDLQVRNLIIFALPVQDQHLEACAVQPGGI